MMSFFFILIIQLWYLSREILEELGMSEEVTVAQARKRWTQLVRRYLELKVYSKACGAYTFMGVTAPCTLYLKFLVFLLSMYPILILMGSIHTFMC